MADARDLQSLRPVGPERIMDLVDAAGIDVGPWNTREDGSPATNPPANPHYCYDWAFGGNGQPTALCVWHSSLRLSEGQIVFDGNLRKDAMALERAMESRLRSPKEKNRARSQAKRAQEFDRRLQSAFRRGEVVRVITLLGEQRDSERPGLDVSKVEFRHLDPETWSVAVYGDDGSFRLVRGLLPAPSADVALNQAAVPAFVDQFSVPEPATPKAINGSTYARSAAVRSSVLRRASGVCELCGTAGFTMESGAVYLETHHLIPLSNGGPDVAWNVVALCPNDHRRAHHAADRADLAMRLVAYLVAKFPAAECALAELIRSQAVPGST
jgi:5-methylcytosine-specific restriction enzyme A